MNLLRVGKHTIKNIVSQTTLHKLESVQNVPNLRPGQGGMGLTVV